MIIPQRNLILILIFGILLNIAAVIFPFIFYIIGLYFLITAVLIVIDIIFIPGKRKIKAERMLSKFLSIGASNKINIGIINPTNKKLDITIRDEYPENFIIVDTDTLDITVKPKSIGEISYHIKPVKKGDYTFTSIYIRIHGMFKIISRQYRYKIKSEIKVYPNLLELNKYLNFLANSKLEKIGYKAIMRGGREEFDFLRNYTYGDTYRQINWKKTAKRHTLITQVNKKDFNRNVVVLIDSGKMMTTRYDILTKLDYSIDASLILASSCKYNKDLYGMMVFNNEINSYIPPSSHSKVYGKILAMLYNIVPTFNKTDFLMAYRFMKKKLSKNSIIFIFSELYNRIVSKDLLTVLKLLSMHHTVRFVSFEEQDEFVSGKNFKEITRWAVQQDIIMEKELIIRELQKHGVKVLRVNAANIKQLVVNSYCETF